jgi:hypothetical protein
MAASPCGDAAGVGTAGFGVGGAANLGPYVMPGTYSVSLVAGGKTLDTKSMKIIMDPAVRLADAERKRYDAIATDLHDVQRLGSRAAAALNALYPQMTAAAAKIKDATNVPATAKSQFEALQKEFDAVRVKFGVPAPAGGGRGGGGGGGRGGADLDNVLARTSALKVGVLAIWEAPTAATVKQSSDAKLALQRAVTEANAFLTKATTTAASLKAYDITLTVPAPVK